MKKGINKEAKSRSESGTLEHYLREKYTAKTAQSYERDIKLFISNYPEADQALYKDLIHYIGTLRNRYSNAKTLNRIVSGIKAYYTFLNYSGKRKDNPCKSIRLKDRQSRDIQLQDLFTASELENLLERAERYEVLTCRNRVLTSLLIHQGLLPTELANLSVADIHLSEGTVYIKGTSKTNSREVPLKPGQIMLLHQYIHEIRPCLLKSGPCGHLLLSHRGNPLSSEAITRHVKDRFKGLYAPRKVSCQTIRQSVISNLLKVGHDLRVVQVFAGHKYPSATEKYRQSHIEALQAAINQCHPVR